MSAAEEITIERLRRFAKDYRELCTKHRVRILALEGCDDVTLEVDGAYVAAADALLVGAYAEWPWYDEPTREYVTEAELVRRADARQTRKMEQEERALYDRLHAKYSTQALPDTARGSALGNASALSD